MKFKKTFTVFLTVLIMTLSLSGCSKSSTTNNSQTQTEKKQVKITVMNSKGEIQTQLEKMAKAFMNDNKDITVEVIPAPAGQSPFEKVSSLYSSGNAPTLSMLDPGDIVKFKDKAADLSSEKWINDSFDRSLDSAKVDGKVIGFPFAVEGYGFIYNKELLDKAYGGNFDASAVKTQKDLEEMFKKLEASGVGSIIVSPMDWSLGGHFLPLSYSTQSKSSDDVNKFIEDLKAGKVELAQNKQFKGLMATLDIMKKHNISKSSPLSGTYENGPEALATKKAAVWFMGNWAWPQIHELDAENNSYAFLPVPISNDAADYGNSEIPVGVTKYFILDKEQNSQEQQAAAKKFLEWIVYNQTGQDYLVNKANVIPAFKNITIESQDPLAKSIKKYMSKGKTLQFMVTLPSDHWSKNGASMQKFLDNKIDVNGLAKEIQEYWKNIK
ncbi:carbohydrate ABC transporter substrate-binding protein, CUT1 family [Caloramator quimbayensis]|uniref:Carbohydrate ABC transporter substrate-binding protein, CUT1 family n=1 Tax=Caloramator quimbayensis TaxID=1147123 RepID=A0A1T4XZY9_9CLOT|nr:ABC transporter substrate-binding protein [Caloramator quimbayensis]SKA95109.1 carbohydrate ABC transporter substrate-binding protein, CUT1 family [Caloramator quimbayensis]